MQKKEKVTPSVSSEKPLTKKERLLVLKYLPLAKYLRLKYFSGQSINEEDLASEASLAVIKAMRSYKPSVGKFSTHLYWQIKARTSRYLARFRGPLTVDPGKPSEESFNRSGRDLKSLGFSNPWTAIAYSRAYDSGIPIQMLSADQESDRNLSGGFVETMEDLKPIVKLLLSRLNSQERAVAVLKYGLGGSEAFSCNNEAIAVHLGVSPQRCITIWKSCIRKMRMGAAEYCDDRKLNWDEVL